MMLVPEHAREFVPVEAFCAGRWIANLLSRAQRFHESVQLIFDGIIRILRLPKQGFGFLLI
jgi:hypothetical protein